MSHDVRSRTLLRISFRPWRWRFLHVNSMSSVSVIDDDDSVRKALCRLISFAGHVPTAFHSAEAFLQSRAVETSDCVILDVHLPGKSGLELQADLIAQHSCCPVIFITAFDDVRAESMAIKAGAVGFLRKPLDTNHLLEVIKSALAS